MEKIFLTQKDNDVIDIKLPTTLVTAGWLDVSPILRTKGVDSFALWVSVTINTSRNLRFRAVALPDESSSDEYQFPIQTIESDIVKVKPEFYELDDDIDQKAIFQISSGGLVSNMKIQVQAGIVGATPATIDELLVSVTSKFRPGR